MDNKAPLYQRAVTPTLDPNVGSGMVKGKVLSYSSNVRARYVKTTLPTASSSEKLPGNVLPPSGPGAVVRASSMISPRGNALQVNGGPPDINIQGRSTKAGTTVPTNYKTDSNVPVDTSGGSTLPRYDLIPLSDELPADGVIFARIRNQPDSLVVFRTPEERLRNPERLNLDRRQLEICPLLEQEQRLRLLNFQNNNIRMIQNLENLPNLIFLDLYNNKIASLDGPLTTVKGLRVLMAGKNKISVITNLSPLRKLDVLDLHSNEIKVIEGLEGLGDLRVLNLAGNRINLVNNLNSLLSLTELNLRRNNIEIVSGLNKLPALQRVFLSHNQIKTMNDISCLFEVSYLIELSLDGNPLSEGDPLRYRNQIIMGMTGLRHLDLKRITDEERVAVSATHGSGTSQYDDTTHGKRENASGSRMDTAESVIAPVRGADVSGTNVSENLDVNLLGVPGRPPTGQSRKGYALSGAAILSAATSASVSGAGTANSSAGSSVDGDGVTSIQEDQPTTAATMTGVSTSNNNNNASSKQLAAAAGGSVSEGLTFAGGNNTSSNNGISGGGGEGSPKHGSGGMTTSMVRSGKLPPTQSLFDLEIIGPDEKALICVGEGWEWTQNKRLLLNVTEAGLFHMKRDTILNKFGASQLASMPALKSVRMVNNDFHSLKNIDFLPEMFGSTIEHLVIKDNPINTTASGLLRCYIVANMPNILTFNDVEVSEEERQNAESVYQPLMRVKQTECSAFSQQKNYSVSSTNNGRFTNLKMIGGTGGNGGRGGLTSFVKSNTSGGGKDRKQGATYVHVSQSPPPFRSESYDEEHHPSHNHSAHQHHQQQQQQQQRCEFSQGALFHRRVNADFHATFENVVQKILLETLRGYRNSNNSNNSGNQNVGN